MHNFLYLKVLAAGTMVILVSYMIFILSNGSYYYYNNLLWLLIMNELVFAVLLNHSFFIFYLFRNYYPDKEVNRGTMLYYRLVMTGAWIVTGLLTLLVILQYLRSATTSYVLIILAILVILFIIQIKGASRLMHTIRNNARQKLENSFS